MSAVTKQSAPLTEKAALADLMTWTEKRPAWHQRASQFKASADIVFLVNL